MERVFLPNRLLALSLNRINKWKVYMEYRRALEKMVRCMYRIQYLEKCYQADIIPKFLMFRVPENGCFVPTVVHNFQRNLLKAEMVEARKLKEIHKNIIETKRAVVRESIPSKLIPSIAFHSRQDVKVVKNKVKETHKKKLEWLSNRQQRPLFDVQDTVKIADKDIHPPQYVIDTLALGPKNAVLDNFDPKDTLAQIDSLLYQCKRNQVSEDIMNEINVATFKYIKACSEQKTPRNIKMTKRYLKDNKLLAVPFDKGVGICVMRKETFEKKLMDILRLSQFEK